MSQPTGEPSSTRSVSGTPAMASSMTKALPRNVAVASNR